MAGSAFAAAKVNLYLHVGAPAADGLHPICSLMAFADVGDRVSIHAADGPQLRLAGPFAGDLAADADNLVLRAARALFERAGRPAPPLGLTLDKRLPVASGLGGGSADAGATLRLLREALDLRLDDYALQAIAASLGSDGAACLWGRPVVARGRGERLSPAPRFAAVDAVLVNPGVPVSTAAVYAAFDAAGRFGTLDPPPGPGGFQDTAGLALWLGRQRNDLQAPAIAVAPQIGEILAVLADAPEALVARVSGSGGTCFALCPGPGEARSLADRLAAGQPDWWVQACRLGGPWDLDQAGT